MISFFDISSAFDAALQFKKNQEENLRKIYFNAINTTVLSGGISGSENDRDGRRKTGNKTTAGEKKSDILLLGRPYTVLSPSMNKNIPHLFEKLGAKTFFQDMIDDDGLDFSPITPLLEAVHWNYAAKILKAAYIAAITPNLYPVYISSFRCSPDSFGIEYFKQIMESFNKPYLILELDEHDSSVGYETRVESAFRAFENHRQTQSVQKLSSGIDFNPHYLKKIEERTIIFPKWDAYAGALIVSVFKNEGYPALLMEETPQTLKKSMLTNTGQCIPLNAVASAYMHTVEKNGLDPAKCALWLNPSEIACNIKLYPYHINQILQQQAGGFERSRIYIGELSLFDLSFRASTNAYFAYMFGGLLRSVGCKIRPYEKEKGRTDQGLSKALEILCRAFETGDSKEKALDKAMAIFRQIDTVNEIRPKVGIFGDLYVRDNDIMNQGLLHYIEDHGGEVVTTPYYQYLKIIAASYFRKWFKEGKYMSLISNKALLVAMQAMEKKYYRYFEPFLNPSDLAVNDSSDSVLSQYGLVQEHTGESMDNLLKIHHMVSSHPGLSLLVQTTPAFCCPGMITEAMAQRIEKMTGVPVASITYDVSGGNKNRVIIPFLQNARKKDYSHNLKVSV